MKPSRFPQTLSTTRGPYRLADDLTGSTSVNYALYRHATRPADAVYYKGRTSIYGHRCLDVENELGECATLVVPSRRPIGRVLTP
jgi:hypothetical protein